ncbi:MAG: metal-dependent hydrolase [Haloferacaceae archaeon]
MPSTLFHAAVGGLIAAALLPDGFDRRVLAVLALAVLIPEIDVFIGLWVEGAHRAYTNNVFVPLALAGLVHYDTAVRPRSWLRARWGPDARRIAGVGVVVLAVAGIGLDLFANGVNLLFPVVDQFYSLDGEVLLSDQRGLVQTVVDVEESTKGTTETQQYWTGVDPQPSNPGAEPADVERVFPLARSGSQILLTVTGFAVVGYRLWRDE